MIIGRTSERKILNRLYETPRSEFLAVYGRRRVGKTYLIREHFRDKMIFDCSGMNTSNMESQLTVFYESLLVAGFPAVSAPTQWIEAFRALRILIDGKRSKKKKVIFLDEISWLDTPRSQFIPALAHFWNNYCSQRKDIMLIICGSVSTWIFDNVFNNKGELHNRHTRKMRLKPFSLHETESFLIYYGVKLERKDIALLYMLLGGIPYYLSQVEQGRSVPQIMDDLFLSQNAALENEYHNLYPALFRNSESHQAIIEVLSKKDVGFTRNEILEKTGLSSGGSFTNTLNELESCGFINKILPINKTVEDALYRLIDEYSIFYHKFLQKKKYLSGHKIYSSRAFTAWAGFAFENLAIKHSKHIAYALQFGGIEYSVYSFKEKGNKEQDGIQIDLLLDRADRCINLVEAKFYNMEYQLKKEESKKISRRVERFKELTKTRKTLFVTLLTPFGAKKNEQYLGNITNQVILDDLFLELVL